MVKVGWYKPTMTDTAAISNTAPAALVRALEELPERTRDIFLMRRYEGLAYGDIAERLGISVSAIEKHVAKAVAYIARRMAR